MRRCKNGHDLANSGFRFCPTCGERLDKELPATETPGDDTTSQSRSRAAVGADVPSPPPTPSQSTPVDHPRQWPLSFGWTAFVALFTAFTGLLVLLAIYLWRGGHKGASAFVVGVVGLSAIAVIAGAGGRAHQGTTSPSAAPRTSTRTAPTISARSCGSYKGAKPQSCISKMGFACSGYPPTARPDDCFTSAQLRTRAAAKLAQARATARRRKAAAAAAKLRAAEIAAANAWHRGYEQQDANVYWRWIHGRNCQDFATNGCWHVAVITQDGCSSYVAVRANEYQGGSIINSLLDNQGFGIPPRTERVFELDADADGVTANDVTIDCT
jgi:hypothetical protein